MRAVVMAGGEGTRLRPLTSNQPKPMVPICNKPCMEHIVELLKRHGIEDIVVTLAFLPKAIRGYFGDGSALGVNISYSVEQVPLGTAGSVKNAEAHLHERFIVISGDALTDFDLTAIIAEHERRGALATLVLKRVENPLEFGVVVINDEGGIERFLEKPTWGQVFSDTVNTGIYVLEPEIFEHIPADQSYDFSQELFPKLLEMGRPLFGTVAEGYWQDVGSLAQYLVANRDVLDGKVQASIPGIRLEGNIYVGENVNLDSLDSVTGPAVIGNYAKIDRQARIGAYSVLGSNVVVKQHAETGYSVIDSNTYVGSGSKVQGAILGKNCDVKRGVTISEGAAIGDECVIGEDSYIAPDVKVYPFKTVESGAQIHSSIIWESRGTSQLFGKDGVVGLINVDITAELGLKIAMAYGTTLPKGSKVVTSRDSHAASRVIKRAIISGLNTTGVDVRDLRVSSSAVNKFEIRSGNSAGGIHVRVSSWDPEVLQIQLFEPPGIPITEKTQKNIEKFYGREDYRRAYYTEMGRIQYPDRAVASYIASLVNSWDTTLIRNRAFRLVIDYSYSSAALVMPVMFQDLGAEVLSLHAATDETKTTVPPTELGSNIADVGRLVKVMGADMGVILDSGAERLYLVDETGREVPLEKVLLLFVRLMSVHAKEGQRVALPLTVTGLAEEVASPWGVEVVRTKVSLPALMETATEPEVIFAGVIGGGYIFPGFLPAFDALMSLGKLLELLAPSSQTLSQQIAQIPASTLVHKTVSCPWALKGTVMRTVTEDLQHTEVEEISLLDGIKVFDDDGWAQILPDADEALFHVYAEARDGTGSDKLAERFVREVRDVIAANTQ
jgi:mannose-1-phosphate guanylyltransferase / phosphomannomutase